VRKFARFYDRDMILVDATTNEPLRLGGIYKSSDGEELLLVNGTPPHKASSSGFVQVAHKVPQGTELMNMDIREYYAGVIGAKWVLADG